MSTANRIRQARLAKGWTQDEFARELGVGVRNVSRWELGQAVPRAKALRRIAEVLGCSVEDLLDAQPDDAEAARARVLDGLAALLHRAVQDAYSESPWDGTERRSAQRTTA